MVQQSLWRALLLLFDVAQSMGEVVDLACFCGRGAAALSLHNGVKGTSAVSVLRVGNELRQTRLNGVLGCACGAGLHLIRHHN